MSVVITKLTDKQYIINGKTVLKEKGKWKHQTEPLTDEENKQFKQHLNTIQWNALFGLTPVNK
ncbi:MAG: hypothetical protein KIG88_11615 [Weeksellaceae bacterium]|nr:hypothetical protein [Weeksellaceae bacterium]